MALFRSPGMKNQIHHQELRLSDENGKVIRRTLASITRDKKRVTWEELLRDQLRAYNEGREGVEALGTPLEQYPKIDVAMAATYRAQGIHSLEQFAAVPDAQLEGLGPKAREIRDGVKRFIESMSGNSALMQQNAELAKQLQAMQEQLAALTAAQAEQPKRGRPSKAAQAA